MGWQKGLFINKETMRPSRLDEKHKKAEIGYKLCRNFWGEGIITNFIGLLLDWGFTELGYNRIEALVENENKGSKIVLLKN